MKMITIYLIGFLYFSLALQLMIIIFFPILPVMILAFPMMVMNEGTNNIHWTQKPYLWWFKNVWLNAIKLIGIN
jgi:hypothetical protein